MGGGNNNKKDKSEGLGRALIRQRNRAALEDKLRGREMRKKGGPLESVIDVSDIDAVLIRAAAADDDVAELADGDGGSSSDYAPSVLIDLDGNDDTEEERKRMQKKEEALYASSLRVPRRPPWHAQMTVEELDANERRAFLEWRRNLARLEENKKLILTPFEKNLDIWRQLWRVLERSDLLVMVVDARDPLFYRCPDLEEYAKEIDEHKRTLLLINKADLLPLNVRKRWAAYFQRHGILYVFWSAKAATAGLEGKQLAGYSMENNIDGKTNLSDLDTKIYGRDELLERLQAEAESIVEQRRASSNEDDHKASSSDTDSATAKHVVVGFIGYPNVGKSSTINALVGQKKTGVTSTPGKTKHFQTLIISDELILCDCPGLVFPSFSSSRHEMVACGVLPIDRMTQHREAVQVVANRVPRDVLERVCRISLPKPKTYELQSRPPTAAELLRAYCASRGHVGSSGLPDETRAARQILKDYLDGKIPHFELPPEPTDVEELEEADEIEGPSSLVENESDSYELEEGDEPETESVTIDSKDRDIGHVLSELESFELANQDSRTVVKKKKEASHKHHKKPQRKKNRSWRVGNDDGDGMPIARVFQKPAVNFAAISAGGKA